MSGKSASNHSSAPRNITAAAGKAIMEGAHLADLSASSSASGSDEEEEEEDEEDKQQVEDKQQAPGQYQEEDDDDNEDDKDDAIYDPSENGEGEEDGDEEEEEDDGDGQPVQLFEEEEEVEEEGGEFAGEGDDVEAVRSPVKKKRRVNKRTANNTGDPGHDHMLALCCEHARSLFRDLKAPIAFFR